MAEQETLTALRERVTEAVREVMRAGDALTSGWKQRDPRRAVVAVALDAAIREAYAPGADAEAKASLLPDGRIDPAKRAVYPYRPGTAAVAAVAEGYAEAARYAKRVWKEWDAPPAECAICGTPRRHEDGRKRD